MIAGYSSIKVYIPAGVNRQVIVVNIFARMVNGAVRCKLRKVCVCFGIIVIGLCSADKMKQACSIQAAFFGIGYAWDVNNYYTEKSWEITDVQEICLVEEGPLQCTVKVARKYLDSVIVQYISLGAESSEIRIRNEIDWNEKKIFMKALFPVDIHTDEASFEIQYGNVTRKTHYNTSWDFARFEVCMHKWLDVSEDGYGVSVLNDCKYGANVHDGVIGISLLKSAVYPNPDADKEHHSFTFSIYPHKGDFREAGTIGKAYALNNPMKAVVKESVSGTLPATYSSVSVDVPNVVIEVVKKAEDEDASIIRLYEAYNRRTKVSMEFGRSVKAIYECTMLEETEREIACGEYNAVFTIKPYEIKTFKVIWNQDCR